MPPNSPRIDISPSQETIPPVEPCTLVIFGGSGDLARRRLIPALYNLLLDGLLPPTYAVIGLGRKSMTDEEFRATVRDGVATHSRQALAEDKWKDFAPHLFYVSGGNEDPNTYARLKSRAEEIERNLQLPGNRIFYLSIPPSSFASVCEGLEQAGLATKPEAHTPYARIIVEKPVGRDLASAQAINRVTGRVFDESQIFRIDHYLGKETVQNLMVVRFANSIFEPIWNHKYIDHVQITVSEAEGVGTRASYYEEAGALRDMVQNHMLQLLCLVAMEPPTRSIRMWCATRRWKSSAASGPSPIRMSSTSPSVPNTVKARPRARPSRAIVVRTGFILIPRRKPMSRSNASWKIGAGPACPSICAPGKRSPHRASEIAVQFKDIPQILFNANAQQPQPPNVLALRIQPEEGLSLRIVSRVPGTRAQTHPVEMDFQYSDVFGRPSPEAYERLLLDVMADDASRFMRRDAVEASWTWITKILEGWHRQGLRWLPEYPAGTWGPVEADRLIQNDGRTWRTL